MMAGRVVIDPETVPRLARHVKMRFDKTRDAWVLLAPERVLLPDDAAVAVLQRMDGDKTVQAISEQLAAEYDAPAVEIAADIVPMLQDLADKGFVRS